MKKLQSMRGAGLEYKNKKYITHTTLPFDLSAVRTFTWPQRFIIAFALMTLIGGFIFAPFLTAQLFVGGLSILYFIDTIFNLILTLRSLRKSNEITISDKELQAYPDKNLPVYTILCPLYKEAHVIPQFVEAIAALDYPKDKLDVMLLLEEDDHESIASVKHMGLPYYFRTIVIPDSKPKTKPKACNYGLSFARGEYLVIFDAEDIPDPLQLKKAFLGFQKVSDKIVCLQAKLNYYNTHQNILTRFFTAEYSLWFDLTLTGLQSFNSTIPLGGTSNHFRTQVLRDLEGWDPFNVTEDADLGIRLFKRGFKTAIIESTTYEEATSKMKNWIRQRSRWIKGYMQTYLVHMRTPATFIKEQGHFHYFIFQLTVGGKILFLLLNPLMWILTAGYFLLFPIFGGVLQAIYQPPISYIAVFSWIFGNFLFLYYYMLGCAKRKQWDLMKYVFMMPFYWGMMSVAGTMALYQLIFKPHYWEKTLHGFHLKQKADQAIQEITMPVPQREFAPAYSSIVNQPVTKKTKARVSVHREIIIFQQKHFPISLIQGISIGILLSFDFVIARLLLIASEARTYFLLSLSSKLIAIFAQTLAYFINEMFSRHKKSISKFYNLIFSTFLTQWVAFVVFGFEGFITLPFLVGDVLNPILAYIPYFLFAAMCFSLASLFGQYHAKRSKYAFTIVFFLLSLMQSVFLLTNNENIQHMVTTIAYFGSISLIVMVVLHANRQFVEIIENNISSFFKVWAKTAPAKAWEEKQMRILIFNWRDSKHVYSGGAEVFIQEIAKRWTQEGNQVTIFCGNDNNSASNTIVDGVEIVRRGGTYTVYLFAFLYYLVKFRGKYDIIVDCENGIPFFAPLFSRRPVVLLIHHVHQAVIHQYLKFPLKQIAALLEGKLMPFVYRNKTIITVSESSKREIMKLGFTKKENIHVIYNGIVPLFSIKTQKTKYPSFLYLGRLKEYKNIDIAIKGFVSVIKEYPKAKLSIVGFGEQGQTLQALVKKLHISENVEFLGRVSEELKATLFAQSWVMVQPSQVEGWGITVIEANAAGTPVIASRVNGLQDSVIHDKTGILVAPRNINQFALAMKQIADNKEYRYMLSQNASQWSKNFDWDKSAADFYRIIIQSVNDEPIQQFSKELSFNNNNSV